MKMSNPTKAGAMWAAGYGTFALACFGMTTGIGFPAVALALMSSGAAGFLGYTGEAAAQAARRVDEMATGGVVATVGGIMTAGGVVASFSPTIGGVVTLGLFSNPVVPTAVTAVGLGVTTLGCLRMMGKI